MPTHHTNNMTKMISNMIIAKRTPITIATISPPEMLSLSLGIAATVTFTV